MDGSPSRELDRAGQELKAACVLADGGFTAQAVSRAYYAARYAAEAALLALGRPRTGAEPGEPRTGAEPGEPRAGGETHGEPRAGSEAPADHEAVISAFETDVVQGRDLAAVHGQVLASLYEQRVAADYGLQEPEPNETWIAIESAEHFVEAVRTWIATRSS
jgi:uncharacterized protein (UPF0332 family)